MVAVAPPASSSSRRLVVQEGVQVRGGKGMQVRGGGAGEVRGGEGAGEVRSAIEGPGTVAAAGACWCWKGWTPEARDHQILSWCMLHDIFFGSEVWSLLDLKCGSPPS